MTVAQFQRHLTACGCTYEPLTGTNITGSAIKIVSPHTNRKAILTLPRKEELYDESIKVTCDLLIIKYPPHLV